MKNKKLIIKMAEFMNIELQYATDYDKFRIANTYQFITYNPLENPAQMNAFIEHPDVMMSVYWCRSVDKWAAVDLKGGIEEEDSHRPTAINKCAALFFDEEFQK